MTHSLYTESSYMSGFGYPSNIVIFGQCFLQENDGSTHCRNVVTHFVKVILGAT
jgi:hypothetical protein